MDKEVSKQMSPRVLQVVLAILLILLVGIIISISNQSRLNNAPANSGAIFGGRLESGYEFAGYIISDLGSSLKICSAIIVSPNQAVTAAHCLDNNGTKFIGLGAYTSNHSDYHSVEKVVIHSKWSDGNDIENDMGLVTFSNPVKLSEYAEVSEPTTGCDYVVVGYGKQDESDQFTPVRKSTDVCIQSTDYIGAAISFSGKDGGLCFGDSGSGIFRKDTNEFITIASSIDSCYINNFAVGAQIFGKFDLATSTIDQSDIVKIACGYIDTQDNAIIDNEDVQAFAKDFSKYCNDTSKLKNATQCGPKDANRDNVLDLIDLSRFAELYKDGECK